MTKKLEVNLFRAATVLVVDHFRINLRIGQLFAIAMTTEFETFKSSKFRAYLCVIRTRNTNRHFIVDIRIQENELWLIACDFNKFNV